MSLCFSSNNLSISPSIHLSVYQAIYLIQLSIYLPIYLFMYLSIYLSINLSICLSVCLSVYLHNGMQFFDIRTSKSDPNMVRFVHRDFEMCFTPQRCAFYRHLISQKWCEVEVVCAFWLRNVLGATTACLFHFSSAQMSPQTPLSWAYFRLRPTNHGKNTLFRGFPNISRTCIFFLRLFLLLSSPLLSSTPLWLSTLFFICFISISSEVRL